MIILYDSAGSVITDKNKKIDSLHYNFLGKADRIHFTDGKLITYTYDASGNKLRMCTTKNDTTVTTDYVGGFIYTDAMLNFFASPEGRVVNNGSGLEYQYAIESSPYFVTFESIDFQL